MFKTSDIRRFTLLWLGIMVIGLALPLSSLGAVDRPEIFVQMGHTRERINAVAFSPDGKYAFTGGWDQTIKVWDANTGREVRTLYGTAKVTAIAVSPDGKQLLTGDEGYQDNLKLWDLKSGRVIRAFHGHEPGMEAISSLLFSADGKHVLSAGAREIKRWDVSTGTALWTFTNRSGNEDARFTSLVISPDGGYVISGERSHAVVTQPDGTQAKPKSSGATIRVFSVADGRQIRAFNEHRGWVEALAMCPDGRHVIAADHEDGAAMWDFTTGRQVKSFRVQGVFPVAVSPDGKYALFGGVTVLRLWDIAQDRELRTFHGHGGWLRSVAFSPDGRRALSGSDDNTPRLWDLDTGKEIRGFGGYSRQIASVSLSAQGQQMLIAQDAGLVGLWDIPTGRQTRSIRHTLGVRAAIISRDGSFAAAGGWNYPEHASTAKVWDTATGREIQGFFKAESSHWAVPVAISADNRHIFWAVGPTLILSDLATGKEIRTFRGHEGEIQYAEVNPGGDYALSLDALALKIWDVATGKEIKNFPLSGAAGEAAFCLGTFSPDGKKVLLLEYGVGKQLSLRFWDITSRRETSAVTVQHDIRGYIGRLSISRDGRFALWSENTDLHLYDFSTGTVARTFTGHVNHISSLGFSADGKYAYSGSADGTARLWELATGREVAQFVSFSDGEWIVITPEGYFNASPGGARHLNVRVGDQVYSVDNFYERFFNPVLVASVLQGRKVGAALDIRKGVLTPPEVRIISPVADSELSADTLTVTVAAKDTGGGIEELRLYHNGKAVGDEKRAVKISTRSGEMIRQYTVSLLDGVNTFRAVGFSRDRTESNPAELAVKLAVPSREVSLHILAVGINRYRNPSLNLNYAEPDARGLTAFFRRRGGELFKTVTIREIYNEEATREHILSQLRQLQDIKAQDAVLLYLAGHGESLDGKWYFLPHELTYPEREGEVKSGGISSDELSGYIRDIKAQKILVLIDACKAGAVLIAFRGFEDRKALTQLSRSAGVHIVAASTKDQFAAEVKELGHGVFTYTLLEGLGGRAAGRGEAVTVRKLLGYVEEKLPEMTKKFKQEAQYPVVDSRGMDFPLTFAR